VKFATRANQSLSGRLRDAAEVDANEAGKAIRRAGRRTGMILGLLTVLRGSRRGGNVQRT
jgi:hypothetical protein